MKTQKKVLALALTLVLAFVMTAALAVTAFAEEATYTIKISETKPNHEFNVYQIFKGDLSEGGVLSNIEWGDNINEGAIATNLDSLVVGETKPSTAAEWAEWLSDNDTKVKDFARAIAKCLTGDKVTTLEDKSGSYEGTVSATGYYLILDESEEIGKGDALNSFILQVVGDVDIAPKNGTPEVGKEVLDKNDSDKTVDTKNNGWGDTADHDIGDNVSFRLTGTLPDNYADYKSYYYSFHDTLSKGLTYNGDAKVYAVKNGVKTDITQFFTINPATTVEPTEDGTTITITCEDLKAVTPVLDKDYEIVVEYTAELNDDAVIGNPGNPNEVYLEYSSDPKYDGEGKDGPKNETPEEKVIVFTYELDVTKVGEDGVETLDGAEFTLEKFIEDDSYDTDEKTGKKGYWKTIAQAEGTEDHEFNFVGLDDGSYRLTETKAPLGYNKLAEPIYFEIKAGHTLKDGTTIDDGNFGTLNFTKDENNGVISTDIVNKTGSNLPSTGGIGTTIFYIIGGVLVALTSVLLITKSRMKGKN